MAYDASSAFFDYPGGDESGDISDFTFLPDRPQADWAAILEHTETRRFAAGELVIRAGDQDRSLYLLTDGTLVPRSADDEREYPPIDSPSVVGEVAFLDGGARLVSLFAVTDGELERLSMERFEILAARHPDLGRAILLDLGRIVARRLRLAQSGSRRGRRR